jgi:hypothetical protein
MSRPPTSRKTPPARLAVCQGQRGLWDGQQFWSTAALQTVFTDLTGTILAREVTATTHPADCDPLPALWWRWGWLGRQLTRLGHAPTPAVPHRLEIIAPAQAIDSIHCWTCDAHLDRPLQHTAATAEAWYTALRTFAAEHSPTQQEAPR